MLLLSHRRARSSRTWGVHEQKIIVMSVQNRYVRETGRHSFEVVNNVCTELVPGTGDGKTLSFFELVNQSTEARQLVLPVGPTVVR